MPPKGKKGKTGQKKSKEKLDIVRPSVKETILQTELDNKVRELAEIKLRAHVAEEENHWLNEEAKKIRIATDEYMHFMSKKANLRQTKIVTLTDYHRKEIEDISRDKEYMIKEYKQKKEELRLQLIEKEQLLIQVKNDLEAMNGYQLIQEQQNNEIKRLQYEITRVRGQHVNEISRMKLTYEKDLQEQRANENAQVEEIRRQANKEAEQFLYDQTVSIQNENVELRKALQDMLKRTQVLNDLKQRLEEEQLHLINRIKLTADLRKIRLDKVSTNIPEESS
ncbi:unnamed protein product [Rotaria sp. Silwood2]|nr:unnamed protein product [Rotaria sp. Silwood2]CAF4157614.1 unnamed protein product [Rotaria sp. Silwood2]CAF4178017.1 unnamed protein product [Rotaria sp. Silwood2]